MNVVTFYCSVLANNRSFPTFLLSQTTVSILSNVKIKKCLTKKMNHKIKFWIHNYPLCFYYFIYKIIFYFYLLISIYKEQLPLQIP